MEPSSNPAGRKPGANGRQRRHREEIAKRWRSDRKPWRGQVGFLAIHA